MTVEVTYDDDLATYEVLEEGGYRLMMSLDALCERPWRSVSPFAKLETEDGCVVVNLAKARSLRVRQ